MGKWIAVALLGLAVVLAVSGVGSYNRLVTLEQEVGAQWGQVENVYQRRADLIPNLVETVRGSAQFEQETLTRVIEARAKATSTSVRFGEGDPKSFEQFEEAQNNLSGALGRLLVSVERYPTLTATEGFRTLQSQLEGTENRIAIERMRFNDAAREFNTVRNTFPVVLFAGVFGSRFAEKPYFKAREGAAQPPPVKFGT